MQITQRLIVELKNYAYNARTHSDAQIKELMNSIKEFGFLDPIEVGPDSVIISGHGRVEAARRLGLKEIPTVCHTHLTKAQRKAYILAANRIAQNAGWDAGLLKDEFLVLLEDDFKLDVTGFTQEEIDKYLNPEAIQEALDDDFEGEGAATAPLSKQGDVWLLGTHRLLCGDSTNPDHVLKLLNGINPNLMVTDPPYGVEYDPQWRDGYDLGVGKRSTGKVKNDDISDWSGAYSLFTGDVIYVWHAGKYSHIVAQNILDCGFEITAQIIWAKQHFALSRGDYHWQHEPCWYAVRKGKNHNWCGKRDQATVWEIKNNNSFGNSDKEETWGHGTQKPLECMSRPIENNSKAGDWVYDPFGGSGTTLIACEKLKRKCVMMELDEKYCDIIIRRWQKLTDKKAVLEETGEEYGDA